MKSSSWLLSEGSRLNFELQLSSKCVQSIGLRVIWECWVRQLWRTLFLSWLWVLERDRAPLITCWCTGLRIQNLFALRWSQTIREGRTWSDSPGQNGPLHPSWVCQRFNPVLLELHPGSGGASVDSEHGAGLSASRLLMSWTTGWGSAALYI